MGRYETLLNLFCLPTNTNLYKAQWGQTTPKGIIKAWQFWLIQNNFACFTSFPTKLGLKIRTIRPSKWLIGCHEMSNYDVKFADVIHTKILYFWISQFFTPFLIEIFKVSWKLKSFSNISNMSWEMTFWIWINSEHKNWIPP